MRKHHYHGRTVRGLFILLAMILLLSSPWQTSLAVFHIPPVLLSVISVVLAGYLSRHYLWVYYVATAVAVVFLAYFEYLTYIYYDTGQPILGLLSQLNMVIMVFIGYYSLRTTYAWEGAPRPEYSTDNRAADFHVEDK